MSEILAGLPNDPSEPARAARAQFAANLRWQRERAGLSQEALATRCSMHRTEISMIERGKRAPVLETIVLLARGLELDSAAELFEGISLI